MTDNENTLDLVHTIAEATDGETVWASRCTVSAHVYDNTPWLAGYYADVARARVWPTLPHPV